MWYRYSIFRKLNFISYYWFCKILSWVKLNKNFFFKHFFLFRKEPEILKFDAPLFGVTPLSNPFKRSKTVKNHYFHWFLKIF